MKFYINYDKITVGKKLLREILDKMHLTHSITGDAEVEINEISDDKLKELSLLLNDYGIEVIENEKNILIQKIKDALTEVVNMDDDFYRPRSISSYLTKKLNYKYAYLSNLFSNYTYTSIENFVRIQKTERAKHLMTNSALTCSEIAWKLNYSSVAHFSSQFKKVTGLTPTAFQRITQKKRENFFGINGSVTLTAVNNQ